VNEPTPEHRDPGGADPVLDAEARVVPGGDVDPGGGPDAGADGGPDADPDGDPGVPATRPDGAALARSASDDGVHLVDWRRTALRVRRSVVVLGVLVLVGWLVTGLLGDGLRLAALGGWVGLGMAVLFVVEVVVVGGAAVRGMLRAGAEGERLAGSDVGLLPTRRRRQR